MSVVGAEPWSACFSYWGKAQAVLPGHPCHLLPFHSLDVAAVGQALLEARPDISMAFAQRLNLEPQQFRDLFAFSLALHDLGKFARSFQMLARPEGCDLVPPVTGMAYREHHSDLGARLWSEFLIDSRQLLRQSHGDEYVDLDVLDSSALWMGCFFGHHGVPPRAQASPLSASFVEEDLVAAEAFYREIERLIPVDWPVEHFLDATWRTDRLAPATWELAGLATLADWMGSNAYHFPYLSKPEPLSSYWAEHALQGARRSLGASGLARSPAFSSFPGFQARFGYKPTPLQVWAEQVPVDGGPQLFVLEDVTGSGKTEAALALAHRLLAAGQGSGLYFGLPTMATSNAMYARLGDTYRGMFPEDARPSLMLAHGARDLEQAFAASIISAPNVDKDYVEGDATAGIECRSWLADNRKKALLAEVGVGTIDQALLAVLPRKHQSMRCIGLARKILVVDEVHAYDIYTSHLLKTLLRWHARSGGSAILLSATLPVSLREQLFDAWKAGVGFRSTSSVSADAFPLASHLSDGGLAERPIASPEGSNRSVHVQFVHAVRDALDVVVAASAAGKCVCWIRNTVDEAIEAFNAVRELLAEPECASLFHARFALADRQRIESEALTCFGKHSGRQDRSGRILIATQVVEQSLDLDFDVLVTDLAPIDLIIQRAGRLCRHPRDAQGELLPNGAADQRGRKILHVVAPQWDACPTYDWVRSVLPGTSFVYGDPAQLWRTVRVLRAKGGIHLPIDARELLEGVYGGDAPLPEGLSRAHYEWYAQERADASTAAFNALDMDRGYTQRGAPMAWLADQEIGTRLSRERSIRVVLAKVGDEELRPWHEDEPHPWSMSSLTLRESQARRLPLVPDPYSPVVDALRDRQPSLRHVQFWLAGEDQRAVYDSVLGAVLDVSKLTGTRARS